MQLVFQKQLNIVYLHCNGELLESLRDIRTILRASTENPTMYKDLVAGWPDYVGIVDASSHGLGGIVIEELSEIPPTVFCLKWPRDITKKMVSSDNLHGLLTNSDLKMAGLLLLCLCIEAIVCDIAHTHVALFSGNSPMISWVEKMTSKNCK
jgi:hypothetical protein